MQEIKWPFAEIEPREVQLAALRAGYGKHGFAYFMRQRLGKTFTAYAEYKMMKEEGKVDWMVVICPNSIKRAWKEEIERVDPYEPVCVYNSQKKQETNYWFSRNKYGGVFIINYESLRSFIDQKGLMKLNPLRAYVVADESIKLSDPGARMSKAALEIAAVSLYTRVLTGKPSKGSNNDLWAQLKFVDATIRNFFQHKAAFTTMTGLHTTVNINTDHLQKEMEPFCFIAEDKYIEGFKKIYEPLRQIEMTGAQARIYKDMEKELIAEIYGLSDDAIKMTAPIILTKYLRLQQISSGIGVNSDNNEHLNIIEPENNPRVRAVKEILDQITGKVIIVCRFKKSIQNLRQELEKDDHKCSIMIGGMGDKLQEQKKLFHEGDNDILIAQEQVLAHGHTLHGTDAKPCLDMIFFENSFSLDRRAQCESRPEKYEEDPIKKAQQKPISYWDFFASKMDKTIIQALIKKEDASMALMGYARSHGILNNGAN